MQFLRWVLLGIFFSFALPGWAQQSPKQVDLEALNLDAQLVQMVRRDPAGALENYLRQFFSLATNGTVTAKEVEVRDQMHFATQRAEEYRHAIALDLDGDLIISESEINAQRALLNDPQKARLLVLLAYADSNGDKQITFSELSAYAEDRMARRRLRPTVASRLLEFDLDGDGKVIAWEIIRIIEAIEDQSAGVRRPTGQPVPTLAFAGCGYRNLPDGDVLVLISAQVGAGLSDITLSSTDEATTVGTVVIEQGRAPVTLMLINQTPMIWRLRGQIERVRTVIVGDRMTGVVGVPRDRMRYVSQDDCLPETFSRGNERKQEITRSELMGAFQHPDPVVLAQRKAIPIGVPSGALLKDALPDLPAPKIQTRGGVRYATGRNGPVPINGPNADLKEAALVRLGELIRSQYPAGLHRFSDAALHAAVASRRMAGAPGRIGLVQALESGALEALPGNRLRITPSFKAFPEGLPNGRFVLPAGIAMPAGVTAAIEVRAEGSDACLAGSTCQP